MEFLSNLLLLASTVPLLLMPLALISPRTFGRFLRDSATRPRIVGVLGILFFILGTAGAAIEPGSSKLTREPEQQSKQQAEVKGKRQGHKTADHLYKVESVVDGDTIEISYEGKIEKVRLVGIDSPETKHPNKPVECFGREATAYLAKLIEGKTVRLEEDSSQSSRDKYGRLLRFIHLDNGTHINEKMVRDGYAFEYTYQSNPYKYQQLFKKAAHEARENDRGLWAPHTCGGTRKATEQTQGSRTAPSAPAPAPATPPPPSAEPNCDPNYSPCIPNVSHDLDCPDIGFSVRVIGTDKHRLDRDKDGYGCE